jgi:hypothetical protein
MMIPVHYHLCSKTHFFICHHLITASMTVVICVNEMFKFAPPTIVLPQQHVMPLTSTTALAAAGAFSTLSPSSHHLQPPSSSSSSSSSSQRKRSRSPSPSVNRGRSRSPSPSMNKKGSVPPSSPTLNPYARPNRVTAAQRKENVTKKKKTDNTRNGNGNNGDSKHDDSDSSDTDDDKKKTKEKKQNKTDKDEEEGDTSSDSYEDSDDSDNENYKHKKTVTKPSSSSSATTNSPRRSTRSRSPSPRYRPASSSSTVSSSSPRGGSRRATANGSKSPSKSASRPKSPSPSSTRSSARLKGEDAPLTDDEKKAIEMRAAHEAELALYLAAERDFYAKSARIDSSLQPPTAVLIHILSFVDSTMFMGKNAVCGLSKQWCTAARHVPNLIIDIPTKANSTKNKNYWYIMKKYPNVSEIHGIGHEGIRPYIPMMLNIRRLSFVGVERNKRDVQKLATSLRRLAQKPFFVSVNIQFIGEAPAPVSPKGKGGSRSRSRSPSTRRPRVKKIPKLLGVENALLGIPPAPRRRRKLVPQAPLLQYDANGMLLPPIILPPVMIQVVPEPKQPQIPLTIHGNRRLIDLNGTTPRCCLDDESHGYTYRSSCNTCFKPV